MGEPRPDYVGRIGLSDEQHHRILIDWRAPVGSSFYRATATEPQGVIRRRTLVSRGRRVIDVNDDLLIPEKVGNLRLVVGEGALLHALVRERGPYMQDIVATIQAEQDEIIRTDPKASVVLTGGPGTGKSVVALHRTAYLMYERSAELERRGVLVVGPGSRFSRYISRVLPSLGETSVSIRSVYDLLDHAQATGRETLEVGRLKGSLAMSKVVKSFLIETYPPAPERLTLSRAGHLIRLEPNELEKLRHNALSAAGRDFNNAGVHLVRAISRRVLTRTGQPRAPRGEIKALARELADDTAVADAVEALLPRRSPVEVWSEMGKQPDLLMPILRRHFPEPESRAVADQMAGDPDIHVGDVPLIDELDWLLGSAPSPKRAAQDDFAEYEQFADSRERLEGHAGQDVSERGIDFGHVVADEAQDLSPMQWRMLARRGQEATWTVVADPRQATLSSPEELDAAIDRTLQGKRVHRFSLAINYRTPRQIMRFAEQASGVDLSGLESIRDGDQPFLLPYEDSPLQALKDARRWLEGLPGSSCVIVPDELDVELVRSRLTGRDVLWALDAKGLEFDNVVLFRPEALDTSIPEQASMVLIGATRATKRLAVVTRTPGAFATGPGPVEVA